MDVSLDCIPVTTEDDMGAAVFMMSFHQQKELFPGVNLQTAHISLRTHTAESVPVMGVMPVQVTYGEEERDLQLVIVQGGGPALLGRD